MDINAEVKKAMERVSKEIERRCFANCEPVDWKEHQEELRIKREKWIEDQRNSGRIVRDINVP